MAKRQPDNRYIAMENEVEERLQLRKPLYEAPGTTEHRGPTPRARASENRLDKAPKKSAIPHVVPKSTSQRAENRAAEKAAEAHNARDLTPDEMFAQLDKEIAATQRAKEVAKKRIGHGREDFRWRVDRETGEAEYVRYEDASGVAWKDV